MNKKALKRKIEKAQTFTREEVKHIVLENSQKHANDALFDYLACVSVVLRDELKFGAKRLEKFHRQVAEQASCIRDGYVTAVDMFMMINDETKFDFGKFHERLLNESERK